MTKLLKKSILNKIVIMDLKDKKPKVPKKVYRWFKLYYTIVDYTWLDPESKACQHGILKPGWMPIRVYNPNHPKIKRDFRELEKRQQAIRESAKVNVNRFREIVFDI